MPCCHKQWQTYRDRVRICEDCGVYTVVATADEQRDFVCYTCLRKRKEELRAWMRVKVTEHEQRKAQLTEWSATKTNAERRALYAQHELIVH